MDDYIDVDIEYEKESEKAYKLYFAEANETVWVPKSLVEHTLGPHSITASIVEWWLLQEGLV